jgi:membrane protease subunit HflK
MPWQNQNGGGSGGPWGGRGGGAGGGGGGTPPPDLEEMLRRGQDKLKRIMPGGGGKGMIIGGLIGLLALWAATGFYRVQADEQGVALIFGKYWTKSNPGLHWNAPAPIGEVFTPKVTRVNREEIGFRSAGSGRRAGAVRSVPTEGLMLTGDENIIDIQFVVFWQIKDAFKYLFNIRSPKQTVKVVAESAMREIVGKSEFEFARTTGRGAITADTAKLIQQLLDDYDAGIQVRQVEIQGVDPPAAVIDAFRDVQAARADKERAVNGATAYRNEVTQRAEGEASQVVAAAEAYEQETIARASGETQRFISIYNEYLQDKDVTRRRLYLETMETVLNGMDKVLLDDTGRGSGVVPYLPLDKLRPNRSGTPPASTTETPGEKQ